MKLPIIYLLACFLCSALALHPYWRLAWSDEFDTLDASKWNVRNMAGNYGNGERQWYHPSQVSCANGSLVITAVNQSYGGEQYMSGRLDTQDKAVFTYGRYEIRAKMAGGKGIWPAMWMLSQDQCWAKGAEIDLAEFRGSYPKQIGTYYHYASKCCTKFSGCISSKGNASNLAIDLTAGFHVYVVEWWPNNMTWSLDGVVLNSYQTKDLSTPQDKSPHYWVINNAIGGSYPGYPDSTTVFPNYHYVDYVRNYVWRPTCSGETCSGHGCCNATSGLCQCNAGYAGASCEYNLGTSVNTFDAQTSLDNIPDGWGNVYTTYMSKNAKYSNGYVALTLNNTGCPSQCFGTAYSSGAWESIPRFTYGSFAYYAQPTKVKGTALSLTAAGENSSVLDQVAFTFLGSNTNVVQLWTWRSNGAKKHADISLGFDASTALHTYSFTFSNSSITWYVDSKQVWISNDTIPTPMRLGPGAYYTAQPDWYGPFTYTGPSSAYVSNFQWAITPNVTKC